MKNNHLIFGAASALLLPLLILVIPWYPWQLSAGLLLIAFLPGYTLLRALWPQSSYLARPEQWLIAVPVSYGLTITLLLVMALAGLSLTALPVTLGLAGMTLLFTVVIWRRESASQQMANQRMANNDREIAIASSLPRFLASSLIFVLLLAAFFRLVNIHYSDYQGDEADILLRAISLSYGQVNALLTHSKGPGEILLLNAIGALTGRFDEQTARLPFAIAGTASAGLVVLLGRQLFNGWAGLAAGLLVAIDGVFVSYARTAQYQSVVLLLTLSAIYTYYHFYQTGSLSRRWHALATFLLAAAFLFHFETVLLLPVTVYLTFAAVKTQGSEETKNWKDAVRGFLSLLRLTPQASGPSLPLGRFWLSALIFGLMVATFYVPFLLNPNLKSTGTYLENRIGGGSTPPFNNLAHFFYDEALKYNSAYYVALFDGLLLVIVVTLLARAWGCKENSRPRLAILLLVILLTLSGSTLWLIEQTQGAAWLLAGGTALFLGWVIFWPQTSLPQRVLWLWLAPSFFVYVFLVSRPGKHHYLFLGALVLWIGWILGQGWQWGVALWPGLRQPVGRWLGVGLAVALLLVFAGHTHLLFLRPDLEYILTYPEHKSAFYPTDLAYPYGTRIGFGYPFRLGWQLVGQLRRTGRLEGSWAGNDDGNAPIWYMLGTRSTPCYPQYVLRGEITYKGDSDFDVPFDPANFGYAPRYRLWGNDRLRLTILEFQPFNPVETIDLQETAIFEPPITRADFATALATAISPPEVPLALVLGEGSELKNNAPPEYLERAKQLNGRVALLGYDVEENYAQPGGIVPITLHWQTHSPLNLRYKVFVHLIAADGRNWGQADDFPVCGLSQANTWASGEIILDRHLLKLPLDLPPGDYTLLVGMYEPDLNLRLNYFDSAGNEQGNSLKVGMLDINERTD